MSKSVDTYIEMDNGEVFRTRFHGDIVPEGSTQVVTDGETVIRFPYVSGTDNYGKTQRFVDFLLRGNK